MIVRRKKRAPYGAREPSVVRCQGHLKWIRGCECTVAHLHNCAGRMHAHHLQSYRAIEGGMGMKVGDDKTIPLCAFHHDAIHHQGQPWFEREYKRDLEATAVALWNASPHGRKYRLENPLQRLSAAPPHQHTTGEE